MKRAIRDFALLLPVLLLFSCQKSGEQYLEAGRQLIKEGKYEEAAINFRNAVTKLKNAGPAHVELAELELARGNRGASFAEYYRAASLLPDDMNIKVRLADLALVELARDTRKPPKLYEEAVKHITALTKARPEHVDTLRLRGQLALLDRKPAEGIQFLEQALQKNTLDRAVILPLFGAYVGEQQFDRAEKLALQTLDKDPKYGEMYRVYYRLLLAQKKNPEALAVLNRYLAAEPKSEDARMLMAGYYAAGNEPQKAEENLAPLFSNAAEYPNAQLRAADLYLQVGNPEYARKHLEACVSQSVGPKVACGKRLANLDWAENKRDSAINRVLELAKTVQNDDELRRMRGSFLLARGKREDADQIITDYTLLSQKFKNDRVIHYQLGKAYRLKQDRENAFKNFQIAIRGTDGFLAPRLELAEISGERAQYREALTYLDQILVYDKENPEVRLAKAATLRILGRSEEAAAELARVQAKLGSDADVQVERALQLLAAGNAKGAEAIFRGLYKPGQSDVRPAMGLVESMIAQKNIDGAIQIFEGELKETPNSLELQMALAGIAADNGNPAKAVTVLQNLLAKYPDTTNALVRLGQTQVAMGNSAEGIKNLRRAAASAEGNANVQLALGTALHQAGDVAQAKTYYQAAYKLDAKNPFVLNNLAYLYAQGKENLPEALSLARQASQRSPNYIPFRDTEIYVLMQMGQFDEAERLLRPFIQGNVLSPSLHIYYAEILSRKGDKANAKIALDKATQLKPNSEEVQKIQQLTAKLQ